MSPLSWLKNSKVSAIGLSPAEAGCYLLPLLRRYKHKTRKRGFLLLPRLRVRLPM